jgi:hypothetical protein
MVEMALTAPFLIVMILGLVEIGFFANDYLILLDAVRSGARVAVNLDPTDWTYNDARNAERMDCDTTANLWLMIPNNNQYFLNGSPGWQPGQRKVGNTDGNPTTGRGQHLTGAGLAVNPYVEGPDGTLGFFDATACQVVSSMAPLVLNDGPIATSKDDIVVSAVSYIAMDYNKAPFDAGTLGRGPKYTNPGAPGSPSYNGYYTAVTGRWPLENRFCSAGTNGDTRDPFDFMRGDFISSWKNGKNGMSGTGLSGDVQTSPFKTWEGPTQDIGLTNLAFPANRDWRILDAGVANDNQFVRGYVFTGNHHIFDSPTCYGSEFSVQDIENRLNLADTGNNFNKSAPNSGLVIVEIFWQYHPLFFGPLFRGFNGSRSNDPVMHVWSFYPIPAVESTPTPAN